MARTFNTTNQSFGTAGVNFGGLPTPYTMFYWALRNGGGGIVITCEGDQSTVTNETPNFDSGTVPVAGERDGGLNGDAVPTVGTITTNVWFNGCAVRRATNDRSGYFNGGGRGNNTNNVTPTGQDTFKVGERAFTGGALWWGGNIGHIAIWNVGLSDSEILSLGRGVSPLNIRRDALIRYWPFNRLTGNEYDIVGGNLITANGSPGAAEEPPLIRGAKVLAA